MVFRFFGFLAAGGIDPVIQRLISARTEKERRGQVFGVMQGFSVGGVMFSALISGGVVYVAGVRGVFLVTACLFILAVLPAYKVLVRAEKS